MIRVYKDSLIAGFTQVSNYVSEIWLAILGKIFQILLLILFWSLIAQNSQVNLNTGELMSYFFVAHAVQVLVDGESLRFARLLTQEIRNGTISSYLLRPINTPIFLYTRFLGNQSLIIVLSLIITCLSLIFFFQGSLIKIALLILTIIFAIFCALGLNLIIGSISFWTTESKGLKHVFSHVVRIFGGSLVPLTFFPEKIKLLILATPLPSFAYIPASLIKSEITGDILLGISSAFIWSIILLSFGFWLWHRGVKQYESVGI